MSQQKNLFEIKKISFSYKLGGCLVEALKNVSFSIPIGKLVTLSGPSGSGKSTLLNLLGLIEPVQKGEIVFNGKPLSRLAQGEQNELRRYHMGFIFQQFHLIPVLSAEENISFFLQKQGLSKYEVQRRVKETLEAVGLWKHKEKRPFEMSGGQRQRVAIARALAKNPEVIIADEPTANLDQKTGREIMEIFKQLSEDKGISIIIATHDKMVQSFSTKNFHIQDGKLVK
ncbi:MAG: ABC transporter ATP-binding protein [Rhabdochlamydiaceae bacterium]|nr:ABC transporter ATP-binding protein [Candidatus Amphrikana amoebophyrae]